jgi:hypothetical protein
MGGDRLTDKCDIAEREIAVSLGFDLPSVNLFSLWNWIDFIRAIALQAWGKSKLAA